MVKIKRQRDKIARRKALEAWSKAVKERDSWTCQMCGRKEFVRSHHILPKELLDTRLELNNGVALCCKCHKYSMKSAHKNGVYFTGWLYRNKPVLYNFVISHCDFEEKL